MKKINLDRALKRRILVATTGAIIIAFGVGMLIASTLGADSINVFYDALSKKTGLTIGRWSFIGGSIMLIAVLIMNRKRIGYTTVVFVILAQFCIDFVVDILVPKTLLIKLIVAVIALIVTGIGCGISLVSNLGLSIYDAFTYCVYDVVKKKYVIVRYIIDGTFLVVGFLLGGTAGIGTIMCLFFFGPAIPFFAEKLRKPLEDFINK